MLSVARQNFQSNQTNIQNFREPTPNHFRIRLPCRFQCLSRFHRVQEAMCCAPCIRPLTGCATAPRTPFRKPSPRPRQPGRESMGILQWDKFPKVMKDCNWLQFFHKWLPRVCHVIWSTSDYETSRSDCETSQTDCATWIVQLASRIVKLAARIVKRVLWNLIFGLWNYKVGLCNSKGGLWNSGVRLWNWHCETLKFHGGGILISS